LINAFAKHQIIYSNDDYRPSNILLPKWTLDTKFYGSYSSFPKGALKKDSEEYDNFYASVTSGENGRDGAPCVYFAGEAFS